MFRSRQVALRVAVGILHAALLLGTLGLTCVAGGIPPSKFDFTNTVPAISGQRSGWKVAQVVITLSRMTPEGPISCVCPIEIGVPEINFQGRVSIELAQQECAAASDMAAQVVLKREGLLSADACILFRREMQGILKDTLRGVRVTDFLTPGVRPTSFP